MKRYPTHRIVNMKASQNLFVVVAVFLCCKLSTFVESSSLDNGLLLVTIATEETDAFKQYMRSVKHYDLDVKVYGMGQEWRGGNMESYGGGHKVNILKEELAEFKDREDLILMFTDSYDVVLTDGAEEILEKFKKFDARVVFSAEGFCWPDKSLAGKYPEVKVHEKRYLCSGGFIGYAKDVYEIVSHRAIADTEDDQLYYTQIFLDQTLRDKWNIKLDTRTDLFVNLHGTLDQVMLKFKGSHSFLYNVKTGTVPVVVHGNGPIKPEFNRLANYLADGWTTQSGCLSCNEDLVSLDGLQEEDFPRVVIGVFVEKPVPFIEEFLEKVAALDYPKKRIDLLIHNAVEMHQRHLKPFFEEVGSQYKSVNIINPSDHLMESSARNWGLEECVKKDCQYYFSVDADCHLDNPQVLQELIKQNRSMVGPVMVRPGKMWSNFWGALSSTGFYARSEDYIDIVEGKKM